MKASHMGETGLSTDGKVTMVTALLVTTGVVMTVAIADHAAVFDVGLTWWQFALAFAVAEWAVAHVEIRNHAQTISMSEAVMLVGLLVLAPWSLFVARVLGASAALGLRRQNPQKFLFNVALFGCEAALATLLFHLVLGGDRVGSRVWALGGLAVLLSVVVGAAVVAGVISMVDEDRPVGLLVLAVRSQVTTAVVTISLAVIGVAAISHARSNIAYLLVLLGGAFVVLKELASAAQRASTLAAVGGYTSTLAGLKGFEDVLRASLSEIADILRGTRTVIVVPAGAAIGPGVYELVDGELTTQSDLPAPLIGLSVDHPALLADVVGHRRDDDEPIEGLIAPLVLGEHDLQIMVLDRSTRVGHFTTGDLPLFAALVSQTQIAGQRATLVDQLEHDAHHDPLTGLTNRLGFDRSFRDDAAISVGTLLVIGLDRFKEVNDTLGHPTGDQALKIIAERLAHQIGDDAVLARLHGDEFAVFDPYNISADSASALAERLIEAIEEPIRLQDLSLQIGASIGLALMPVHGNDAVTLMRHAGIAMYLAKTTQSGWQLYSPEDDTSSPRRLDLIAGLRAAIESRQLDVWYQPKLSLGDAEITSAEALVRWNHPRYGFVQPDEFIALAEQGGLMRELTNAVIERVAADTARWTIRGRPLQVAVNLSMRNLLDDTLPERIAGTLTVHGVGPEVVSFEVTETAIMSDRDRVTAILNQLRSSGFRLAIDDYGTGYSSLAYLRNLPVDELKIDRAFVTNLDNDNHNEVIVRSTIDLGHNLGMKVVAEGVERSEELAALELLGCDYVQGYLISRPLPVDEFEVWLADHDRKAGRAGRPTDSGLAMTRRKRR